MWKRRSENGRKEKLEKSFPFHSGFLFFWFRSEMSRMRRILLRRLFCSFSFARRFTTTPMRSVGRKSTEFGSTKKTGVRFVFSVRSKKIFFRWKRKVSALTSFSKNYVLPNRKKTFSDSRRRRTTKSSINLTRKWLVAIFFEEITMKNRAPLRFNKLWCSGVRRYQKIRQRKRRKRTKLRSTLFTMETERSIRFRCRKSSSIRRNWLTVKSF